jgi:hypothetical protein
MNLVGGLLWNAHDVDEDVYMATHAIQFKHSYTIHFSCKWFVILNNIKKHFLN